MFCKDYQSGIGVFVSWNHTAETVWGLKETDVLGKSDYDFFPKDQADFFKDKDLETIESGQLVYIEEEPVDSPNLGRVLVRTWKVPIDGRYLLGVSQDITQQKKMEGILEKEKLAAIHASRMTSLGEMSAGLSHEINNPLAIVEGLLAVLERRWDDKSLDDDSFHKKIETIKKHTGRIQSVVSGLATFAKDSVHNAVNTPKYNESVNSLIDNATGLYRQKFEKEQIEMRIQPLDQDAEIFCHKADILHIIINLLNNAYYAALESKDRWVELATKAEGNWIKILITDSGQGIEDQVAEKIFDPFFTTREVGMGRGLGLSICKGLSEEHGGDIAYDKSNPNTRFTVTFPKA